MTAGWFWAVASLSVALVFGIYLVLPWSASASLVWTRRRGASFESELSCLFLQVFVRHDAPSSVLIVFDTENRIFGLPRELVVTVAGKVTLLIKALSFAFCTGSC